MKVFVEEIVVSYDSGESAELIVLNRCRVVLSSGEPTVLLGPNGSGKTTLLRVLAGDLRPRAGEVRLLSEEEQYRCDPDELRARVEFVRQDPLDGLFPSLCLNENLALRLSRGRRAIFDPYRRSGRFASAEGAFHDLAPLYQGYRGRRLMTLSVGERQLFAIALAQFGERKIVLLDEPTAALDVKTRNIVEVRLKQWLTDEDVVSLIVTHDERFADRLGFRRIHIDEINSSI